MWTLWTLCTLLSEDSNDSRDTPDTAADNGPQCESWVFCALAKIRNPHSKAFPLLPTSIKDWSSWKRTKGKKTIIFLRQIVYLHISRNLKSRVEQISSVFLLKSARVGGFIGPIENVYPIDLVKYMYRSRWKDQLDHFDKIYICLTANHSAVKVKPYNQKAHNSKGHSVLVGLYLSPKDVFFWQISIVIIFRGCLDGACGLVFSLKRCDSVTLVSFKVMCWITVCVYNLKFTTDWLKSPFIKSSNDFTYCVEGLVSWHLMSEYEVGEHTGGAPGHPHLAVHQHLACGRWCHFIFDFKKGTHPLQPGPRLWTGRPLENAEKCFAGAHPAVSTPCTWCRRESNKPVFSGWFNFYFDLAHHWNHLVGIHCAISVSLGGVENMGHPQPLQVECVPRGASEPNHTRSIHFFIPSSYNLVCFG